MFFTDKHVALLRLASERDDAHLAPPERLVGAARHRMAARLLELGVAEPVPVAAGELQWSRTGPEGATGLRLTEAGRAAARHGRAPEDVQACAAEPDEVAPALEPARVPRPGSKAALLLDLLGRDGGAAMADLSTALGWQAHTVRAALTRLRQSGSPVERVANEAGRSVYRLASPAREHAANTSEAVGQGGLA